MKQVRKWSEKLKDNLSEIVFIYFKWQLKIFEGKDHNNTDIPALING